MTQSIQPKCFQIEDLSRIAITDGAILSWDTGLGKSWAAYLYGFLKCGVLFENQQMIPQGAILLVVPGDLHHQIASEDDNSTASLFAQRVVPIYSQATFLRLAELKNGKYWLPNGFYITSYSQLGSNGVSKPPEEFKEGCGVIDKNGIKCVYQPTLSDLCMDTFDCVIVDEGVRMKGDHTLIGLGIRRLRPKYRLVMTASPIKNRLPDIFFLAHWATGGKPYANAKFPYNGTEKDKKEMSETFLICEQNLTKERNTLAVTGKRRRFKKLTPQVTQVHRLWKMLGPIVLRRRRQDCGEDVVQKIRRPIRVPMGTLQRSVYQYHMTADYRDKNGKACVASKLQALRQVASDPTSTQLQPIKGGDSNEAWISNNKFTPKLMATLRLILQVIQQGEQIVVFASFHSILDRIAGCLSEAGVPHLVLDGRTSQQVRGKQSFRFKTGQLPVTLAGSESMSEGHDWPDVDNVAIVSYSWAMDKLIQAINRVHRLTSRRTKNYYPIIADGSIDRILEEMLREKEDASELVLDGKLTTENEDEVNLYQLLQIASQDFGNSNTVVDEELNKKEWLSLSQELRYASNQWKGTNERKI